MKDERMKLKEAVGREPIHFELIFMGLIYD